MAQGAKSEWWRAVLGEYPTGVVLICSLDEQGAPVGMVVGSFTPVSQDPPLVGFLPDATSTTFPKVAAAGRFSASVLGDRHEELCRAFAARAPDRFERGDFVPSPSGIPRLQDAVAWFDAEIEQRTPYGDHEFVVARVEAFGVGNADAGLPLLFRRGGYGSFAVPAEEFDSETVAHRLRMADESSDVVGALAERLGQEVAVATVVRDRVVVLTTVAPSAPGAPTRRRIGAAFPFAAPIAPAFVAWAPPEQQQAWIEGSRHLIGSVDRPGLAALLRAVRRRGYGVSADRTLADRMEEVIHSGGPRRESFARLWADMAAQNAVTSLAEHVEPGQVSAVQAPVFGPDGAVELVLTATGFDGLPDSGAIESRAELMLEAAATITRRIGGTVPERGEPAGAQ